jgi:hypothetical protein
MHQDRVRRGELVRYLQEAIRGWKRPAARG